MNKIIDLSMDIYPGMPVYPGDPGMVTETVRSLPEDDYRLTRMSLGTHTGTHVDAPLHFLPDGTDAAGIDLSSFIGEAIFLRPEIRSADGSDIIDLTDASKSLVREGDRIIFSTGWERKAGSDDYFRDYPVFSAELLAFLLEKRPLLLGADLPTLAAADDPYRMHREMFSCGTVFVEGLIRTRDLSEGRFFFAAAPLKIVGGDGSPARAYVIVLT